MYFLVYLSNASPKISEENLLEILTISRKRNATKNITGMLLYADGNIVQVIEGNEHDVIQLFSKIEQDPRHYGIIKLIEGEIPYRNFEGWSMGFKSASFKELEGIAGYTNLSKNTFLMEETESLEHPSIEILKSFYENYKNVR